MKLDLSFFHSSHIIDLSIGVGLTLKFELVLRYLRNLHRANSNFEHFLNGVGIPNCFVNTRHLNCDLKYI